MSAKSNAKKKKPFSNLVSFMLCVAILGLAITMIAQQTTMSKLAAEEQSLSRRIQEQQEDMQRTEKQLEETNELERIEQIARQQLGMLKPGERVFVDSSR